MVCAGIIREVLGEEGVRFERRETLAQPVNRGSNFAAKSWPGRTGDTSAAPKVPNYFSFTSGGTRALNSFSSPQIEIGSGNVHSVGTPARYLRYSLSRMS